MDNKALAEFGVLFRQAQETVNRLTELAGELDEENRPKVYRAGGGERYLPLLAIPNTEITYWNIEPNHNN